MNNLHIVLAGLLGAAGLAAFTPEGLPRQKTAPTEREIFAQAQSEPTDTTKASTRASKKKKDKKKKEPAAARVTMKRDVSRATLSQRSEEGNNVEVVIVSAGVTLRGVEEMQMVGSSGTPLSSNSYIGFDNVSFPFAGNIRFKASNKMGTVVYDREVRFEVNEPGRWTLRVDL